MQMQSALKIKVKVQMTELGGEREDIKGRVLRLKYLF